jgi:putative phosphoesterase
MRIGLISDTHGLVRPEALAFLRGCDHIVHAGDVGKPGVLAALSDIAPLTAIRGNVDRGEWVGALPEQCGAVVGGVGLFVLHDLKQLDDPPGEGVRVVVSGHSHRPAVHWRDGVLYINPGSAGPRRFNLPVTAGELHVARGRLMPRIVRLLEPGQPELPLPAE